MKLYYYKLQLDNKMYFFKFQLRLMKYIQMKNNTFTLQQLVRRKPSEVDYIRPTHVQKDTYTMNSKDCKNYLENIGKEIVSDSKKEFTSFVKNFDSNELKKRSEYLIKVILDTSLRHLFWYAKHTFVHHYSHDHQ